MNIFVTVIGQKLRLSTNNHVVISGSNNFIKLIFQLPSDWDDLTVHARFVQNNNVYEKILNDKNTCFFPSEIEAGKCTLMIYGIGNTAEAQVATTTDLEFTVEMASYIPQ